MMDMAIQRRGAGADRLLERHAIPALREAGHDLADIARCARRRRRARIVNKGPSRELPIRRGPYVRWVAGSGCTWCVSSPS
jgi:hypothetical protein